MTASLTVWVSALALDMQVYCIAVASGPAGPVLAGPVFAMFFFVLFLFSFIFFR